MSYLKIFTILVVLTFVACKNAPERPEAILPEGYTPTQTTATNPNIPPPPTAEPAQNANGIWHYTCPNGCAGGGGSAIACPNGCGGTLAHNKAYHDTPGASTPNSTTIATNTNGVITTPPGSPVTSSKSNPEPAQNAAGVWHYTCPNGCAGGGGTGSLCAAGCGATLAHNAAYHN